MTEEMLDIARRYLPGVRLHHADMREFDGHQYTVWLGEDRLLEGTGAFFSERVFRFWSPCPIGR